MLELKEQLIALCVESGLNIEMLFFVFKDIMRDIEDNLIAFKKQQKESTNQEIQKLNSEDIEIIKDEDNEELDSEENE